MPQSGHPCRTPQKKTAAHKNIFRFFVGELKNSLYFCPRFQERPMERCRSGRSGRSRKPLYPYGYPGFESLSFRQQPSHLGWVVLFIPPGMSRPTGGPAYPHTTHCPSPAPHPCPAGHSSPTHDTRPAENFSQQKPCLCSKKSLSLLPTFHFATHMATTNTADIGFAL